MDEYAETQVLPGKPGTARGATGGADNLALYEEYARELDGATAPDASGKTHRKS